MAITTADIHTAADRIAESGQQPTLAAVRSALGGGSFTTIQDGMTEWKAKKAAKAAPLREPAPGSIGERVQELAPQLLKSARDMSLFID